MFKRWGWLFSLIILFSIFFCYLVYAVWGGKYYFEATKSINRLSEDKRAVANSIFNSKGDNLYSGVFMGATNLLFKGIWIWGEKGPKFFKPDEFTVYSYFQMCTPENTEKISNQQSVKPKRDVSMDIKKWSKGVKTGDFITTKVADEDNGGNLGRLREAFYYDWWVFDPSKEILSQCKK